MLETTDLLPSHENLVGLYICICATLLSHAPPCAWLVAKLTSSLWVPSFCALVACFMKENLRYKNTVYKNSIYI